MKPVLIAEILKAVLEALESHPFGTLALIVMVGLVAVAIWGHRERSVR